MSSIHIESPAQWRKTLNANVLVVADFYADWCGPCKMIAPTFESLSTKYTKPGRIAFAKVNVDHQQAVAQMYAVSAMPTFVMLLNGAVVDTVRGATPPKLAAAVDKAVKLVTGMPGAAFKTPGRTLGSAPAAAGAAAGATAAGGASIFGRARSPVAPTSDPSAAWDTNRVFHALITFVGLYFTSLLSFDPYMAARNSRFNVQTPSVAINMGSVSVRTAAKPADAARGISASKPTFATLADL